MREIYVNGVVYTVTDGTKEAFVVENEKFLYVGSSEQALTYKTDDSKVIDLEGQFVTAGFNDSHMHIMYTGNALTMVDLTNASSIEELVERSKKFIAENDFKKDEIVIGSGFNQDYYPNLQFPTRYDLDKISTTQPVIFIRTCYHVYVANSYALKLFGIDKNTPQVEGGLFDLDENGEPLGIFRENAFQLLTDHIPTLTIDDVKTRILKASALCNSYGITSVGTDDLGTYTTLPFQMIAKAYEELDKDGKMTLKVNEQNHFLSMDDFKTFLADDYRSYKGKHFKYGPLKMFVDGSLGARTALLNEPYEDDPSTCGQGVITQEELDEWIMLGHENGMNVAAHSIGDRSAQMILNSVEKALAKYPRDDHRHGIVHAQILSNDIVDQIAKMKVNVLTQTIFIDYDAKMAIDRVGPKRLAESYTYKRMLNKGINVSNGSDSPIELPDVFKGMEIAITRESVTNKGCFINPEEAFTREEAIASYTTASAFTTFEEDIKGQIKEGYAADFVILDKNLMEVDVYEIHKTKALKTFVDGKCVFSR